MDNMHGRKEIASNDKYRRLIRFMCLSGRGYVRSDFRMYEQFIMGLNPDVFRVKYV